MIAAVGVLVWGLLLSPDLGARCSFVLIHEGEPAERIDTLCSAASRLQEEAPAGWIWSRLQPPTRFSDTSSLRWPAAAEPAHSVRVEAPSAGRRERRDARLIAAPVEMWEEVPETLLPDWSTLPADIPTDRGRPWRLRLLDRDRASWWMDLDATAGMARPITDPAEDFELEVVDPTGAPIHNTAVQLFEPSTGLDDSRILAVYRGGPGRVSLASLPTGRWAALLVTGRGSVPLFLSGKLSAMPRRVVLSPAIELSGRFVTQEGLPVRDVEVHIRSWLPGAAKMLYGLETASDETGRWSHAEVPPGEVAVVALKDGLGRLHRTVDVEPPATDLGDLVLRPGAALEVRVLDDAGSEVPGARIVTAAGHEALADDRGLAVLDGLESGGSVELQASAAGHLRADRVVFVARRTSQIELVLRRAHTVAGRLVDARGMPAPGGSVRSIQGSTTGRSAVGVDGRFEVGLEPGRPATLALASAGSLEIRTAVAAADPGAVTDLGDLALPAGATVTGRVLDDVNGLPVAGARIWAPRADAHGPIAAWVRGDLLRTRTDSAGLFRLTGVSRHPNLLRIEAPGHARRTVPLTWVDGFDDVVDLGEIFLSEGVSLVVEVEPPPKRPAELRVDLRGQWLELDMLQAPVVDGSARVENVPPGPATLSAVSGRDLLCLEQIELPDDAGLVEARCRSDAYVVEGVVTQGGRPLGPGRLVWQPPSPGVMATILRRSELGLEQSEVYGGGRPSVLTAVAADGTFRSERLGPGDWRVVWSGESGTPGAPVPVHLRDEPKQEVSVLVPGGRVWGRVVDSEGEGIGGARIRLTPGGALALSDPDGAFEIGGVAPGQHFLRARLGDRTSDPQAVELIEGVAPEPVALVIGDDSATATRVQVWEANSEPAGSALVFLEDESGRYRVLTTDRSGQAQAAPRMPPSQRRRPAVFHHGRWTLGDWAPADQPIEVVLDDDDPAALRIWTAEDQTEAVRILGPGSWDLSWLLARAGLRPMLSQGQELELAGIPAGSYTLAWGGRTKTVFLTPGELAEVELDGPR